MADQRESKVDEKASTTSQGDGGGDQEHVMSMVDVLEEENQLEEDANAVLGDSDMSVCTYSQGHMPRQALYACVTCVNPLAEPAGVCLACSIDCHEGHELYELYTKRNFRCDCGNAKFPETKCKLTPDKCAYNKENSYCQNFHGKYCTCGRPYPDPEDPIEDEMIQCVVCEDWFHGRHVGAVVPEEFDEMICQKCSKDLPFLLSYDFIKAPIKLKPGDGDKEVDVTKTEPGKPEAGTSGVDKNHSKNSDPPSAKNEACKLSTLPVKEHTGSTFWKEGWRSSLCKCAGCLAIYEEKKVSFLYEGSDTIMAYEARGKERRGPSQYDAGMQALSSMGRVQQVEALHGYNDMKSHLTEYLKKFAENGKVVREEDIKEFFSDLKKEKKQKVSHMPYFCK